ncbi:MAG: alpha/beta hydrolase [Bacteroidia bacterium]|nr:alpha/beta hydrolase [Bacteroidia bacterium]
MRKFVIATVFCFILGAFGLKCAAQDFVEPDETYLYAEKDSTQLYLDIYYPSDGSEMTVNGVNKPTILYVFGGGFKGGSRDSYGTRAWFKMLADEGFTIVAIDYRLGLKNATKMGIGQAKLLYEAIRMAVEDTFSATNFLLENSEELDIDPSSIVVSGSSAGAITALQAEWEICNGSELASVLPEGFNYAGVMSFAGAIYSKQGSVRYKTEPAPTLMFHGTADKIVTYKQIRLFNQAFQGTGKISKQYIRKDYDYNIYRFDGNSHEIAGAMVNTIPEQVRWLNTNVIAKEKRIVDALVSDPSIRKFNFGNNVKELYGGDVNLE